MLIITDYSELEGYVKAFAAGHLKLMLVCGPPGVGKSYLIRKAVGDNAAWVDGNASAFGLYCFAYQNLDLPIVLDDVDRFYRDKNSTRLLTALCQSDSGSWVSWETDAKRLKTDRIPTRYYTSSHVCLVCNSWNRVGHDVQALEDRGHFVLFTPTAEEVHRKTAEWFWDQEVYDEVAGNLGSYVNHSFRTYIRAAETKAAGLDWRLTLQERRAAGDSVPAEYRRVLGTPPQPKDSVRELRDLIARDVEAARSTVRFDSEGGYREE